MTAPVPVLTAVSGADWEAGLVAALERDAVGLRVVRRCVDLADLLATAASGQARAVLLSADLRRLDREALDRLSSSGVAVVGLFSPGNDTAERRLRQLGVRAVLSADSPTSEVAAAVVRGLSELDAGDRPLHSWAHAEPLPPVAEFATTPAPLAAEAPRGQLVAVWGPTGSPGRTTVAVNMSAELAHAGHQTLLADADTYGAAVGQYLGVVDDAPGLAGAARAANVGELDVTALARHARAISPRLRVLTGLLRPDRWPELRPAALETVWEVARRLSAVTVVDCGFCLEEDEELAYDTMAPRRNGATLSTVTAADLVLVVGSADPVGVQRLIRAVEELRELAPRAALRVVVNRMRRSATGPEGATAVERLLAGVGVRQVWTLPEDRATSDLALLEGRPFLDVAPQSALRAAVRELAGSVLPPLAVRSRRAARRRRSGWRRLARATRA